MQRIAKFEKVSLKQFEEALHANRPMWQDQEIHQSYETYRLPQRATAGSAGYDFYALFDFTLRPGETILVPTGVRVRMEDGWVLQLFPRSGLGFKFRMQLNNTVGIIDSDYYRADNEGHIFAKITNDSKDGKMLQVSCGDAFMQGIFLPYGITEDDSADGVRSGGFGSTGNASAIQG